MITASIHGKNPSDFSPPQEVANVVGVSVIVDSVPSLVSHLFHPLPERLYVLRMGICSEVDEVQTVIDN